MSKNRELDATLQRLHRLSDDLEALIRRRTRALDAARAKDADPGGAGGATVTPLDPRRGVVRSSEYSAAHISRLLGANGDPKLGTDTMQENADRGRRLRGERKGR